MEHLDFGEEDRYVRLDDKKDPLVKLNAIIPWEMFRPRLRSVWREPQKERKSNAGRKPWDEIVMFKAIILCALYNLSDEQVEYQMLDRLSFTRFLGLELKDSVPDARTVWLYRNKLARAGVIEELFADFDGHLNRRGYKDHGRPDNRRYDSGVLAVRGGRSVTGMLDAQPMVTAGWCVCRLRRIIVFLPLHRGAALRGGGNTDAEVPWRGYIQGWTTASGLRSTISGARVR